MKGTRTPISEVEADRIWYLWKSGSTLSSIAREVGRKPGTLHGFLSQAGGIAPPQVRRPPRALTKEEREEISRGLAAGLSMRSIAKGLGRAPSTVSREVSRNGGRRAYRSSKAEPAARRRRRRPQPLLLQRDPALRDVVVKKLECDWSPEQIAGWLRREHPDKPERWVSHEAIYRALYLPGRSSIPSGVRGKLRSRRKMRKSRRATTSGQTRGQIVAATPISARPAGVASRKEPGHWEGDLIAGKANSWVATLVERTTRYTSLLSLEGKDSMSVTMALLRWLESMPTGRVKTLTWDRGTELARHAELTARSGVPVYFCDPKSPWQRGTNENTNRLIRQYLPKAARLDRVGQTELDQIAQRLNTRPRKVIGYNTPRDAFIEVLR